MYSCRIESGIDATQMAHLQSEELEEGRPDHVEGRALVPDHRTGFVYDGLYRPVVAVGEGGAVAARESGISGGVLGLIFGPLGSAGGVAVGAGRQSAGARSTSQRTLTVIINFDDNQRVRDFAYHSSRF